MKINLTLACFIISLTSNAINYYVKGNGNDNNNGLTVATPFRTIQSAANLTIPGDTVFVMNGTYTNNICPDCSVAYLNRSGTNSKWIVYTNYPGQKPLLKFNGWSGFAIDEGAHHIEISGFRIQGNNKNITLADALNQPGGCNNPDLQSQGKYNGSGISVEGRYNGHSHHLKFLNNTIYDCASAGISVLQGDYVTVTNNIVCNNCWYTIYGASGISFYQQWNLNNSTAGYRNTISNNICFGNRLYVPWIDGPCAFTDGNGIIIDDSKNTQNGSTLGKYKGRTYVYNNVCFNNGGSGIHAYESEHVDIVNNTAFRNSQTPEIDNGQIFASNSNDVYLYNNILVSQPGKVVNSNYSNTNVFYDYNLHWGGTDINITGPNCIVANPQFINPTLNLTNANFDLQSTSPAVNAGTNMKAPLFDFKNQARPSGSAIDIGAYEYQFMFDAIANAQIEEGQFFTLYPNPATSILNVKSDKKIIKINVLNEIGIVLSVQKFQDNNCVLDISSLKNGVYFMQVLFENGETLFEKYLKQ